MFRRAFETRVPVTKTKDFPAPTGGWVQSGNIVTASPNQAERLDNFIPTAQGARLRGGASEYADIGASVVRLFQYTSGSTTDLFASTATGIYDADRVNGTGATATFADVEGLSSGDWATVHQSSSAGQFLITVNGTDLMHYWDGTDWNPVTDEVVYDLGFDAESAAFTVGETVSGGTSGASAEVLSVTKSTATAGTLRLGAITAGPFQNNEALTGSSTGAATADGASAAGSTVSLTGVATTALSQGWVWKERSFFIEKNTTSAWYLPVNSIGGAASELDLGSVMNEGGALLFGANWSLDSGSGLDDVCVFVTTEGELLVYEGTDPSSADTWSLVGVYRIGTPLNKHGHFRAGGDLAILTEDGIISVSEALRKDRAALQGSALTYPIEDAWKEAVANRTNTYPISATLWHKQTLLLIGTPAKVSNNPVSFAANARTGAWARFTGWDVRCSCVADDVLYFGNTSKVLKADDGGDDDGMAFTGVYVPKFFTEGVEMSASAAGITYRANDTLTGFRMEAHADYVIDELTTPVPEALESGTTWGGGDTWGGGATWGSSSTKLPFTDWQAVRATGTSLAPSLAITSNQSSLLVFEILLLRMRVELGYPL